jgi:predicted metal-binding membrane protein
MIAMPKATPLESLLKRDRAMIVAGLIGVAALAWLYLLLVARGMSDTDGMAMIGMKPWGLVDAALMFVMWAVMMVAMMVPSAAPMILLYGTVARRQGERGHVLAPVGAFASGYILAWTGFGLLATLLQWGLERAALLSPMMVSNSALLGGSLLIAAGIYQWTPLKHACLENCRSPIRFLSASWRPGAKGAVVMGLHHGLYCVGCCWLLMALLFVGGVMNLIWVAAIAFFVLIEKALPRGVLLGRLVSPALILAGLLAIAQS